MTMQAGNGMAINHTPLCLESFIFARVPTPGKTTPRPSQAPARVSFFSGPALLVVGRVSDPAKLTQRQEPREEIHPQIAQISQIKISGILKAVEKIAGCQKRRKVVSAGI
jgi:hypothetical protein